VSIEDTYKYRMSKQKTLALLDQLYGTSVDGTTEFYAQVRKKLTSADRVLDLGCGFGRKETDVRSASRLVVGCDPTDDVMNNQFVHVRMQGSAYDLPFQSSIFDAVLMDYVLEHIEFPEQCARELFRVLKPGGKLFFRTPNLFHYVALIARATPHSFHQKAIKWIGKSPGQDPFETFYRVNTIRAVKRCFEGSGFVVDQIRLVEKEPSYLMFSRPTLILGYCYERLVNSWRGFAQLRSNIFGFFVKPSELNGSRARDQLTP
jgi:SAM-dependent methyltransferase